jgi:iron complex outermembrane receptor protein
MRARLKARTNSVLQQEKESSMSFQKSARALAVLLLIASLPLHSSAEEKNLPAVVVTASPGSNEESLHILSPAKVLAGDELRDKLGGSLGDTLSLEPGVSASSFGAGASRPILRGLDGPRIKILQNGMAVSDLSGLSNDHAVSGSAASATQIEILRGPASLAYGSGAIGGLINIVNGRIPDTLVGRPTGEIELRHSSVDNGNGLSLNVDGSSGNIGLHADGNLLRAEDYRIPAGVVASTFNREDNAGFGASTIGAWGHAGLSIATLNKTYGIPTADPSRIDLSQTRIDIDSLINTPWQGIESLRIKLANTDYAHTEFNNARIPQTHFNSQSLESRIELAHLPLAGWRGTFGLQNEDNHFSALAADGSQDTVPLTRSTSMAGFIVEEKEFGPLLVNAGLRYESVQRTPEGNLQRSFGLTSWSGGGLWRFASGYDIGTTFSLAQRAPATEELYSAGPHDATGTFDIGNPHFDKEISHNIELSLQKSSGIWRWKGTLFQNKVQHFIYGVYGGKVDENGISCPCAGDSFTQRNWAQGDASLYGGEAELSYNTANDGLSWRGFADTARGRLDGGDNLPLQPAARLGFSTGYQQGAWRSGTSLIHAAAHERIAVSSGETPTAGYTRLDANLSYTQHYGSTDVTWFVLGKNLLNQDIRLSTSILKDLAPSPGRNIIIGMRSRF